MARAEPAKGLVVSAPFTSSGKTSVTLGLLRAFSRRGLRVAPAKIGPDYIDPRFHEAACGTISTNLDGWAMRLPLIAALAQQISDGADMVVAEGMMGLFDGAATPSAGRQGTSAEIARLTGWPVLLVVDGSALAQSIAPLVQGFRDFDPDLALAGVITNKVGGPKHQEMLADALAPLGVNVLGQIPHQPDITLPSRHLGLVQAEEQPELDTIVEQLADLLERHCDLDGIAAAAVPLQDAAPDDVALMRPLGQRIALAQDVAFRFTYRHLLDGWRRQGAEIVPFSPLADQPPDNSADAVYLPGGYPELHAGQLAEAQRFKAGLSAAAERGAAIFGECGGYMVLGRRLVDADGVSHQMTGLLNVETSFAERQLHIGYFGLEAQAAFAAGEHGARFHAHEFHFARVVSEQGEPLFKNLAGGSAIGLREASVAGSFAHLIDIA